MSPAGSPAASSPCVLIVDDDAGMRAYMRECLADLPMRVIEAADGIEAMACLAAQSGDCPMVIVADVHMPHMDGLALREELRRDPRWADTPVLLVTGDPVRARDGPILRKPFNAARLGVAVLALL